MRLAKGGDEVTVVTGFPNYPTGRIYPGYEGKRFLEEEMDGFRVLRTWVYATRNAGFVRRILNHLSFACSSLLALRRLGHVDVYYVQSPPLFVGIAALMHRRLKHAPYVFNVSDIWPQSAIELGALRNPLAIRLAEMLERTIYRKASRITVPTTGIYRQLSARGIPSEKLILLTNGVDVSAFHPAEPRKELARRLGLDGASVFLYAGTHGLSQGLDVILEAAKLTSNGHIRYVLMGEGANKDALVEKARAQGIRNVQFLPNQPKAMMPDILSLAYASIVSLRRLDVFRSALPSKMFESMAAGKPLVAALWGEGAEMVETAQCGLVVEPGDPKALRDAVEKLAADPKLATTLGRHGREYAVAHYDRDAIAERLRSLLHDVAGK